MLIAIWLGVIRSELYTIRESIDTGLALTITGNSVGFQRYDPSSEDQKVEILDGEIMKDGKRVCVADNSNRVSLCVSSNPKNSVFNMIERNGMFMMKIRGTQALATQNYDMDKDMKDAQVIEESRARNGEVIWFVIAKRHPGSPFVQHEPWNVPPFGIGGRGPYD